jgi:hypothetical protein
LNQTKFKMKKCKKCSQKSGVSGFGDASLEQAAGAAAGALAANQVDKLALNRLYQDPNSFLGANPTLAAVLKSGVKALLGVYLMGMDNEIVKGAGTGMVAYSAYDLGKSVLPNVISGQSGLGSGPQYIAAPHQGVYARVEGMSENLDNLGTQPDFIAGMYESDKSEWEAA